MIKRLTISLFLFPVLAVAGTWSEVLHKDGPCAQDGDVLFSADAFIAVQCDGWQDVDATFCFHYPYDKDTGLTDPVANLQADQFLRSAGLGYIIPRMRKTSPSIFACVKNWLEEDWRSL